MTVMSGSGYFDYSYSYKLKKDQTARIVIKKDYLPTKKSDGILEFRWTLYKAKKLVLLVRYEGIPTQYLLEKRYKRDSIKIDLLGDYSGVANEVFAIVRFKDFKNSKADFDVLIRDPKKRLEVRFK